MKKQLLLSTALSLGAAALFGANTFAEDRLNITTEDSLKACLEQTSTATCSIGSDISVTHPITIKQGGNIILNTNTYTISNSTAFTEGSGLGIITINHGATLTVNGSGTIETESTSNTYAVFRMTEKTDTDNTNPANLIINGSTIIGDYYAITGNGSTGRDNTNITINGGTIKGTRANDNLAIYHPQNGTLTINGGTLTGYTGIGLKAGTLTLKGGSIVSTGATVAPSCHQSGINVTGAAIQIESQQPPYSGPMTLNFNGGTVTSENSVALQEYTCPSANTAVESITITNANFTGATKSTDVSTSLSSSAIWAKSIASTSVITNGAFDDKTLTITANSAKVENLPQGTTSVVDATHEVTPEEQAAVDDLNIDNFNQAASYDISLTDANGTPTHELDTSATFTLPIPTDLPAVADGYTRTFYVVRVHKTATTALEATRLSSTTNADGTISFESNQFSTFIIGYVDTKNPTTEDTTTKTTKTNTIKSPETGYQTVEETPSAAASIAPLVALVLLSTALFASKKFLKIKKQ